MAPYLEVFPSTDGEVPLMNQALPLSDVHLSKLQNGEGQAKTRNACPQPHLNYTIPMHPQLAYTPRKLRVITVGAGFSGLMMAHKLQHQYPEMNNLIDHTIFEARSQLSGTWLVNTYPGVQCDVPSAIYVSHHSFDARVHQRCSEISRADHKTRIGVPLRPEPRLDAFLF